MKLSAWRVRLRALLRRSRLEREMDAELRFHFDQIVAERIAAGRTPAEARRDAQLTFGGLDQVKEDCRDVTVWRWLESVWLDVRHGWKNLRKAPGLVVVSILSLGLGIGLNLTIYSAVTTVFGRTPSLADADRVFSIQLGESSQVSYPTLRDLAERRVFATVAGFRSTSMTLRTANRRSGLIVIVATANFFETLGIPVERGRGFDAAMSIDAPAEAVISHDFWTATLAARSDAIGQVLMLDGEPVTVVGILPANHRSVMGFVGPQLYVSANRITLPAVDDRRAATLTAVGRLHATSTQADAQAAATEAAAALARSYPQDSADLNRPSHLRPAGTLQYPNPGLQFGTVLLVMLFALVLVIGCTNVAGMQLARTVARRHELSIRSTLGAGRGRVMQTVLVESALLTLFGFMAALILVVAFAWFPPPGPLGATLQFAGVGIDLALLAFAGALAILTAVLCGAAPAIAATRHDALGGGRLGMLHATSRLRLRQLFVQVQVAVSLLLLGVAALCLRSQLDLLTVDLGFDLTGGLVARVDLDPARYPPASRPVLADTVLTQLKQLPGVESAAVASLVPLGTDSLVSSFHPAGRSDIPGTRPSIYRVGPDYFATLGIPLVRGREFDARDDQQRPPVVIVNETFVQTYFPHADALGQHVQSGSEADAEIVGVVADSRIDTIGEAPKSVLYYAWAQRPRGFFIHVRTAVDPAAAIPGIERAIRDIDSHLDFSVRTRSEAAGFEMTMRRSATQLVGAIGVVGLLLTLVGLYGIVAYMVASRTTEFGIRMALGASPAHLQAGLLCEAGRLVVIGIAVGSVPLFLVAQGLATFLLGVSVRDLVPFAATCGVLLAISLTASYLPARRVLRLDPVKALKA